MTRNAPVDDSACATGSYSVEVDVDFAVPETRSVDTQLVVDAIVCILSMERVPRRVAVNVLLTGDGTLRRLNRRFAGEDHATDVLAFPAAEGGTHRDMQDMQDAGFLGDIAVSVPRVARQALDHRVSAERELAMLAIHGTLHLLGYDHATPDEERVMFGKTDLALAQLFTADGDSG